MPSSDNAVFAYRAGRPIIQLPGDSLPGISSQLPAWLLSLVVLLPAPSSPDLSSYSCRSTLLQERIDAPPLSCNYVTRIRTT